MSPTLFSRLRSALRAEPKNALALPVVPDRVSRYPVVYPGSAGKPFPLLADLIEAFSRESPPDVLFFGDSVLERISNFDDDKRTLVDMLRSSVARDVYFANRPAFNPTLGVALMGVIGRLRRPTLLVVEINIRCFSPQWDQNPSWAFQQELAAIDAWLDDPAQPLRVIEDVRASAGFFEAFDRTPVNFELSKLAAAGQFRALAADRSHDLATNRDRARELFIFHYTHRLVRSHRKLVDLVSIAERATQLGIDLLLYLTPINSLAGEEYVGGEFRDIHNHNIRVLREALGPNGKAVLDLSTAFPRSAFFHPDLPTEHLNQAGRSLLVSALSPLIERSPRPSQS
jgi:hypothetical protein